MREDRISEEEVNRIGILKCRECIPIPTPLSTPNQTKQSVRATHS